ncbi:MAG: hypothetical protein EXS32_03795 [Opitutus sp.]|nr:hypothetical protein [Opitutus sp.]
MEIPPDLSLRASGIPAVRSLGGVGFSLLEVVVAVGIFALGLVAVLGIFAPITKSIATVSESEAAARVADSVLARLRAIPFDTAATFVQDTATLQKNDASGAYNPNDGTKNPFVIFGKRDGEVGFYDPATGQKKWRDSLGNTVADADKYFEIELIRNDTLSPKTLPAADPADPGIPADATATMIAFSMRVRWPSFLPASSGTPVQVGFNAAGGGVTYDHGKKQVLFFTGTITR